MKKKFAALICLICFFSFWSYAADQLEKQANSKADVKSVRVKTAKMNARGKVVEIFDKTVKIERNIKGNVETMEFILESPVQNIAVNDSVKIDYQVKEGVFYVARIAKLPAGKYPLKNVQKPATEK